MRSTRKQSHGKTDIDSPEQLTLNAVRHPTFAADPCTGERIQKYTLNHLTICDHAMWTWWISHLNYRPDKEIMDQYLFREHFLAYLEKRGVPCPST